MGSAAGILLLLVLAGADVLLLKAPFFGLSALILGATFLAMRALWRWGTKKRDAAREDGKRASWCVLACVLSLSGGVFLFQNLETPVRKAGEIIRAHAKVSGSFPESLQQVSESSVASRATGPTTLDILGVPIKYVVNESKDRAYLVYWSYGYLGQTSYDITEQRFTTAPAE